MFNEVERANNYASSLVNGKEEAIIELMKNGAEFYIKTKLHGRIPCNEFWAYNGEKFYIACSEPLTLEELVERADNDEYCYEVGIRFGGEDFVGNMDADTFFENLDADMYFKDGDCDIYVSIESPEEKYYS